MGFQAAGYVVLLGVMFGSMSVVSRFMLGQFEPVTFTAVRLFIAAVVFLAIYLLHIRGRRWPKNRNLWIRSIVFGVVADTIPIILIVSSLQYLSSGLTTTLTTFFPVVTVIMAHFLLPNEPLNKQKILGVSLATIGAISIVALGETGLDISVGNGTTGYLMIAVASLISGSSTIFARKYMMEYEPFDTVSIRMIAAAATSALLAVIFEPDGVHGMTSFGTLLLFYAAGIFFSGFLLGFYILKRFGVMIAAVANYLPPVFASFLGFIFLSEKITMGMLAGMGMILTGVIIINLNQKKSLPKLDTEAG
jgi:drug/metabolite transporter (DMT)-like permease